MEKRILSVIEKTFEINAIDQSISQKNCAKWDSMNHLNLIVELESEFDVSFEPEEISEMKDFNNIRIILADKIGIQN